jgi:ABC-type transporter Mla subunit MlaD
MSNTQKSFFDSLASAVQENPLAAALIGSGALWLLSGNDRLQSAASSMVAVASPIIDIGARNLRSTSGLRRTVAPPTAPEMDHEGPFRVGETLRDAGHVVSDVVSEVRDRFDEGVAYSRENIGKLSPTRETLVKTQSSLANIFERQPLVLGAIGLAIGAAAAGALRTSDLEHQWVGDLSDAGPNEKPWEQRVV